MLESTPGCCSGGYMYNIAYQMKTHKKQYLLDLPYFDLKNTNGLNQMRINNALFHQTTQIEKEVIKDYLIANFVFETNLLVWIYASKDIFDYHEPPFSGRNRPNMHNL